MPTPRTVTETLKRNQLKFLEITLGLNETLNLIAKKSLFYIISPCLT